MLVFLTGATGFVGSHVARALAAQGADLRLLVRSSSDLRNIQELQAERVIGDLRDASVPEESACRDAMWYFTSPQTTGCGSAIRSRCIVPMLKAQRRFWKRRARTKCAAWFTPRASRPWDSNRTAISPTRSSPVSLANMIGPYKRSKFMAEEIAIEAGRSGMDVVVVNPTTPVGERDIKPTPTGRIVVDFLKKKFPAYVDTGLNLVDVAECARGHVAALEKGKSGERYILGGENLTLKQILDKLAAITGLPSPKHKSSVRGCPWRLESWIKYSPVTFEIANLAPP